MPAARSPAAGPAVAKAVAIGTTIAATTKNPRLQPRRLASAHDVAIPAREERAIGSRFVSRRGRVAGPTGHRFRVGCTPVGPGEYLPVTGRIPRANDPAWNAA
jgi:hypothetical protein